MAAEELEKEEEETYFLKSSDGVEFAVSKLEANLSMPITFKIQFMLHEKVFHVRRESESSDDIIHLNVKSNVLAKVVEYCRGSHAASAGDPHWAAEFIDVDLETLCDLIMASENLRIQGLLELACRTLANKIKGKSPQEIRTIFTHRSQEGERAMSIKQELLVGWGDTTTIALEQKVLKALHIVRCQEFTQYDPKQNDIICTRFFSLNVAFFDLDEESRLGRGHHLHQKPSPQRRLIEESSVNVISMKIRESDVGFPIYLFGTIVARDELDYKCVYLFRRESDDAQLITSPDDMLALIDPSRGLVASDRIYFEFNLKIKTDGGGAKDFSKGLLIFNSDRLAMDEQSMRIPLTSWLSEVVLTCAHVLHPVEATIAINFLKGRCNISRVEAWTTENSKDRMILYDNSAASTRMVIGDGGSFPLMRRVVAVPFGEKVVISLVGDGRTRPFLFTLGHTDEVRVCKMGRAEVQVKIAWTAMQKRRRYDKVVVGYEVLLV